MQSRVSGSFPESVFLDFSDSRETLLGTWGGNVSAWVRGVNAGLVCDLKSNIGLCVSRHFRTIDNLFLPLAMGDKDAESSLGFGVRKNFPSENS